MASLVAALRCYRRRARVARAAFAARLGSAALRPDAATSARDLTGAFTFTGGPLGATDVRVFFWQCDPRPAPYAGSRRARPAA